MNSSPNRAPQSTGKSRRKEVNLDLTTARRMLPLVRSIVTDIVETANQLNKLETEQATLDEYRRSLTWASRERRYAVHDATEKNQKSLKLAVRELDTLGVALVDSQLGSVDFPTRMNGRPAAFSWQLGEEQVDFWRYVGEELRRPISSEHASNTANRSVSRP
jgi:hypothetical protein